MGIGFINQKRILVRFAEDGGLEKEGVIEIRPGVKDLDLGKRKYAHVKIAVGSRWYIKGMAMYSNDIPDGFDIIYYTSKPAGTPLKTSPKNASKAVFTFSEEGPIESRLQAITSNGSDCPLIPPGWFSFQKHIPPAYLSNLHEAESHLRIALIKASRIPNISDEDVKDMALAHVHILAAIDKCMKGE